MSAAVPEDTRARRRARIMRIASSIVSIVFLGAAAWWASKQKMPKLPSGGHMAFVVHPDLVADELRQFVGTAE